MTILLGILKVIGIIVLVLILVLLLAILSVLFVPLRYRVKADYNEMLLFEARISWLLHIVGIRIYNRNDAQNYVVTLFGFPVWDKKRSEERKRKRLSKNRTKKKVHVNSDERSVKKSQISNQKPKEHTSETSGTSEKPKTIHATSVREQNIDFEGTSPEEEKAPLWRVKKMIKVWLETIKRLLQRLFRALQNIKYTFERTCDKIKECIDNIKYYQELLQDRRIQSAIQTIRKWFIRFWKNIKPKEFLVHVEFGMEDPATVADIMRIYSVLYPWIGQNVFIIPQFQEAPVIADVSMKGKITVFWIVYAIWKFLFDRDIRYLKKRVIREEK